MLTRESVIDFLKEIIATCKRACNTEVGCASCPLYSHTEYIDIKYDEFGTQFVKRDKGCALDVFNLTEDFCPSEWKIEEDLI